MKNLYITLLLLLPLSLMAQENSAFLKFFQNFSGKEGYTTINISSELLRTMMVVVDEDEEDDLNQLINTISAIRIVISQSNTKDYENALDKLLEQVPYNQISVINEGRQKTEFYQLKKDSKVVEFMMISRGSSENMVINVSGDINVEKISKLSQFGFPPVDTLSIKP